MRGIVLVAGRVHLTSCALPARTGLCRGLWCSGKPVAEVVTHGGEIGHLFLQRLDHLVQAREIHDDIDLMKQVVTGHEVFYPHNLDQVHDHFRTLRHRHNLLRLFNSICAINPILCQLPRQTVL